MPSETVRPSLFIFYNEADVPGGDRTAEQEKVCPRGIGDESRSRAVYAKLESNSGPERARVSLRVGQGEIQ